jgi:hypothetical protein
MDKPLRLDNARALPTCPQQQTKKTFKPRFKVDHAASPMPETRQPERLAPRATSNRNGGRHHLGILGEIKSVHPGEIIGISSLEILACHEAGITVTLPKPQTSGAKSDGRFGKQDFVYLPEEDAYRCPAGERLPYRFTNEEDGKRIRRYYTTACQKCSLQSQCTTGPDPTMGA